MTFGLRSKKHGTILSDFYRKLFSVDIAECFEEKRCGHCILSTSQENKQRPEFKVDPGSPKNKMSRGVCAANRKLFPVIMRRGPLKHNQPSMTRIIDLHPGFRKPLKLSQVQTEWMQRMSTDRNQVTTKSFSPHGLC